MPGKPKLVLIDGHALIHRAFHAFARANLTTPTGEPSGAVYGFATMLLNIFTKLNPDYIILTMDSPKPTFRHDEYKEYKATRVKAPQELYDQIDRIREVAEAFNIPIHIKDGFEADDIIGTLAHQTPKTIDTFIATGDMDALQLVNDHTFVYAPGKGFADILLYTPKTVEDLKGLKPSQWIDYKGLRGDPSDNIPGVPGIGEVSAKKMLIEFGSMENIYKNLDRLSPRTRQILEDNKEIALLSKKLATICLDCPIDLDLNAARAIHFSPQKVAKLFAELGFRSLMNKIPGGILIEEDTSQPTQASFFEATPSLTKRRGKLSFAEKLDKDLEPVLRKMEKAGIMVDTAWLAELNTKVVKRLTQLTKNIHKHAGREFNINSPIQLAEILYKDLQLPTEMIGKTKNGYSTAAAELEKLAGKHPIIKYIFEYRELEKLRNTYLETLPKLVGKDGRIHTTYTQDTSSGRLSSKDPNLQNIPIRSDMGAEIRKAFIAPKGYRFVVADYSQIELRVVASLAHDKRMMEAFNKGVDIHTKVAAEIYGVKPKEVTKNQRRDAKTINFGIIYGVSAFGLAARTDMSIEEASQYIHKYFELYPGIKRYMEDVVEFAKKTGYTETLFGRRRYFPEITSRIPAVRNAAARAAINMPIQGTAADIMKAAMIVIDKKLPKTSSKSRMLLQVHDELVLEVPEKDVKKVSQLLETEMENVTKLDVPIKAEACVGSNWGETK